MPNTPTPLHSAAGISAAGFSGSSHAAKALASSPTHIDDGLAAAAPAMVVRPILAAAAGNAGIPFAECRLAPGNGKEDFRW